MAKTALQLIALIERHHLQPRERADLLAHIKRRDKLIRRCRKLLGGARRKFAERVILKSLSLRVCVAMQILPNQSTFNDVIGLAARMKLSRASNEPIKFELRPKAANNKEFRTITKPGLLRRARQMLVRDVLEVLNLDGDYDYITKGGERALLQDITEAIEDRGQTWVGSTDIKDCYPSIGPEHLIDALPPREIAKECVKLSIGHAEQLLPSENTTNTLLTNPPPNQVRPGLLQGSLLSPLLARIVIAKVLDKCPVPAAARVFCFVDNIYIAAPTRKDCEAALRAIQRGFAGNQVGQLICHKSKIWNSLSGRAQVLGYVLEPGRNQGRMHRKPGPERFRRYRRRLFDRISQTDNVKKQFHIAETYTANWFNAQAGWTRVPVHSWDSALTSAYQCVADIRDGVLLPDGTFKRFPVLSAR